MNMAGNTTPSECPYCAAIHKGICPKIKRVEYSDLNPGTFKVVEFFAPNDYPSLQAGVSSSIFEQVFGRR